MIRGVVGVVPADVATNIDESFIKVTGVRERRVARALETAATLGTCAAYHVLHGVDWEASSLKAIICITQTPTSRMPGNAAWIASHLGFTGIAFDVNMACSGFVYGLWLAHQIKGRVLLVVGDTVSKMCAPGSSETMLFGDAVCAVAVSNDSQHWPEFRLSTDGDGYADLVADPLIRMDGGKVMAFALRTVPPLVEAMLGSQGADLYLFHQANAMILQTLLRKCHISAHQAPTNIARYGNTSSASIPLLMAECERLRNEELRVGMFAFGAGWSWGGAVMKVGPLKVAKVVEVS